ncbi:MAG: serine/threonine-protein kinase [Planctomycetota bacterium]|nr:serine/threonine-protein kinase [Planctomycetota bacterium]
MKDKNQPNRPRDNQGRDHHLSPPAEPALPGDRFDKTLLHQSAHESQQTAASHLQETVTQQPGRRPAPVGLPEQFGRYQIKRQLGQGGMGAVYLAHDQQLDRDVALKIPFFDENDGPEVIQRFYREARAMAALQHANLCPVFDVGELNGVHFLAMAYIAGRPLNDYLKKGKPLTSRQVAGLIRKLALALHEAHSADIIHRDLKPANIMIDKRKEPIVMDFGLARRDTDAEAALTHTGTMMGTPSYMAPELIRGIKDQIGAPADIFALGVMLYEMSCGRKPFEGSLATVLSQILTEEPTPLEEVQPDIPPELSRICAKAMSKAVETRYASAGELAIDLDRFLKGSSAVTAVAATTTPATTPTTHQDAELAAPSSSEPAAVPRKISALPRRLFVVGGGALALVAVLAIWYSSADTVGSNLQSAASGTQNSQWTPNAATNGSAGPDNPFGNDSAPAASKATGSQGSSMPNYKSGDAIGSAPPNRSGKNDYRVATNQGFRSFNGSGGTSQTTAAAKTQTPPATSDTRNWFWIGIPAALLGSLLAGVIGLRRIKRMMRRFKPPDSDE